MNIRIYQVNIKRDPNNVCFMPYNTLERFQGSSEIDSRIYDKVFEGNVDCKNLEEIHTMFNIDHPQGYRARSLSVSDIVELVDGDTGKSSFHFCDSVGFQDVNFNPGACQPGNFLEESQKQNTISVLLVQPEKYPKVIEIEPTLEAMQQVVGGDIEEYMPFEDEVALICNEEGKVNGLPLNRAIYNEGRQIADIIAGDFFITYAPIESERFESLPKALAEKYRELFKYPERFFSTENGFTAVPFKPTKADRER